LFHNANLFGSCIIHILYTGCAKIKKKIRRQRVNIVLNLPEDGRLRPKHVAKYNLIVIIASCLDVCCVLTVHNIWYKFNKFSENARHLCTKCSRPGAWDLCSPALTHTSLSLSRIDCTVRNASLPMLREPAVEPGKSPGLNTQRDLKFVFCT